MERQEFEKLMKGAFRQSEISPSGKVWTNIELELQRAESDRMRRKLVFYKLLAAASVVFGICLGGAGLYVLSSNGDSSTIAQSIAPANSLPSETMSDASREELVKVRGNEPAAIPSEQVDAATSFQSDQNEHMAGSIVSTGKNKGRLQQGNQLRDKESPPDKQTDHLVSNDKTITDKLGDVLAVEDVVANSNTNQGGAISPMEDERDRAKLQRGNQVINSESLQDQQSGSIVSNYKIVADGLTDVMVHDKKEKTFKKRKLPSLVWTGKVQPQLPKLQPDAVDLYLASVEIEEKEQKKRSTSKSKDGLWASMGASAGLFNPISSSVNGASATMADGISNFSASSTTPDPRAKGVARNAFLQSSPEASTTLKNETKASGMAYTIGLQMGGKVARRWVLFGGVNYLMQNSQYTSSVVAEDPQNGKRVSANSSEFNKPTTNNNKYYNTAPHKVSNSMEFVSVPVQAGFVVLNKSFGVQLNSGISTDLFLQNTAAAPGNLDKATESKGSDSAFRPVNFSGLFGTEFSYRVSDRYRIALNPGVRYPFSSIYKSDSGLQSVPVTFDVGLKFRYFFN